MAYNNTLPGGGYPQMGFPTMPQMGMNPLGMMPPVMMGMSQLARSGQDRQAPIGEPIFIDGVQQAYAMATMPDTDKIYFDKEEPVFYHVAVDRVGIPTVKVYCFKEVPTHQAMGAMGNYVTREEIGQMIQAYIMATKGGNGDGQSALLGNNEPKK